MQTRCLWAVAIVSVATGCGQSVAIPSGPGSGDVPAFAPKMGFFHVAPPVQGEPMAAFQEKAPGMTLVFDDTNEASPQYECEHDDTGAEQKLAENDEPAEETCALPEDPKSGMTEGAPGDPGTRSLPKAIDNTWAGYGSGGCGTWATAMCNRILGVTDPKTDVSKDEWNKIAHDIHQSMAGASRRVARAAYYAGKGYCVEDKDFDGTTADYTELKNHFENDHCDVKLSFYKRNPNNTYSNGHVETVTGATNGGVTTNSWGQEGVVVGGSAGGFRHSLDGTNFKDASGNPLWPANSTDVVVTYVCKCPTFSALAASLGF